jgi:hypothetical protein
MNLLTFQAQAQSVVASPAIRAAHAAANSASGSASLAATPATKTKTQSPAASKAKSTGVSQHKKIKKMPVLSSTPMVDLFQQFVPPMLPMANSFNLPLYLMQMQQYPAMFQGWQAGNQHASQGQPMQQFLFDPTKPPLFDSSQAMNPMLSANLNALFPGSLPPLPSHLGVNTFANCFGLDPNAAQFMSAHSQNM